MFEGPLKSHVAQPNGPKSKRDENFQTKSEFSNLQEQTAADEEKQRDCRAARSEHLWRQDAHLNYDGQPDRKSSHNFHHPIEEEDEVNHQSEADHQNSEESFEEIQIEQPKRQKAQQ